MQKLTILNNLPKNIPLLLKSKVEKCGNSNLQAAKNSEGKLETFTYAEVYETMMAFTLGLRTLGVKRGSNVALISDNRKEWLVTDFAIQFLGAADVPRGCDSMGGEIRFIINFADCEIAFLENGKQLAKVMEKVSEVPALKSVVLYDKLTEEESKKFEEADSVIELHYYEDVLAAGKKLYDQNPAAYKAEIEDEMEKTNPDDVCTIIFTSGTTGTPKGVMLTHENYMSQFSAVHNYMVCKPGKWWMSILPVWHSFERLAQYVIILLECGIAYSKPNAKVLLADMAAIKPIAMCGVPRLWEALAKGVEKTMKKTGGITYKLYKFFMKAGKKYADYRDMVRGNVCQIKKRNKFLDFMAGLIPFMALWPVHMLGNVLVYRKIKAKFGGKFIFAVSGGGAMQKETNNFFRTIGLSMLDGYGMTETAPAIAFSNFRLPQNGCTGKVFPTIECKIVREEHGVVVDSTPLPQGQRGAILIRGPHVMKGYYKRQDLTDKVIDSEGWLNTGDIGMITFDGDIKITGRAKDTIVLLDGENIEPVEIENAICSSEFIETAVVVGQDKKFLASLIVPAKEGIINYAKEHSILYKTYEELLQSETIKKLISAQIAMKVCLEKGFRICEKIARFTILPSSFTIGNELSAKQEIMRYKIYEKYSAEIEQMYA